MGSSSRDRVTAVGRMVAAHLPDARVDREARLLAAVAAIRYSRWAERVAAIAAASRNRANMA